MNHQPPLRSKSTLLFLALAGLGSLNASASNINWSEIDPASAYGARPDSANQRVVRDLEFTVYTGRTSPDVASTNLANRESASRLPAANVGTTEQSVVWNDRDSAQIYRANSDGSNPRLIIDLPDNGMPAAQGIAVSGNRLFWTGGNHDAIYTSDLDGYGVHRLIGLQSALGPGKYFPTKIAADNENLYWSDIETGEVYQAGLDGKDPKSILNLDSPFSNKSVSKESVSDEAGLYWTAVDSSHYHPNYHPASGPANPSGDSQPEPTSGIRSAAAASVSPVPEPAVNKGLMALILATLGFAAARQRNLRTGA